MALVPVYRDVARALFSVPHGYPAWPAFAALAYAPHRPYFDGLLTTYGDSLFGPGGLPATLERTAPALRQALAPAPAYHLEQPAGALLERVSRLLPTPPPDLYLSTLFFMAPAATLAIRGRPAIALGLERFHPNPPAGGPKYWYHPEEIGEMLPHEAAHCARMAALGLPPTPRLLSLLEMVMLEGTALLFTDLLQSDRSSLATFMPPERLRWHRANDALVRRLAAAEFGATGMNVFLKYFSAESPISGYYVGYTLCREYLDRFGRAKMPELLLLPSAEILLRLGFTT